ncbi:LamB/YcsF family protein [Roseixanthobacter pseudopolyaromaticivorans]|uniref:LamB/YcsF family protein n=1 Tax=Xanthobacteraceae TaxID=335928 RepID=UPI00372A1188
MRSIDLNADLGEGFGRYVCGDDAALLALVSSASVACGFHAGDPDTMARTFAEAKRRGVQVGAHPGFADLAGFGRRRIPHSAGEIERLVAYQIGAAQALARYCGHEITYVKPHGALGNLCETDADAALALARAVKAVDGRLACLCIAGSAQVQAAERLGLVAVSEVFGDRGYGDDGRMVPRGQPGALITDPQAVAERTLLMVRTGALATLSGRLVPVRINSVCFHGDAPHAVESLRRVRVRLAEEGIAVAPFATVAR